MSEVTVWVSGCEVDEERCQGKYVRPKRGVFCRRRESEVWGVGMVVGWRKGGWETDVAQRWRCLWRKKRGTGKKERQKCLTKERAEIKYPCGCARFVFIPHFGFCLSVVMLRTWSLAFLAA